MLYREVGTKQKLICKKSEKLIFKYKIQECIQFKRPTVTTTLKNLVTLYRKQGRTEAADQLDNCAVKIKKDVILIKSLNSFRVLFFKSIKINFSHQQ